MSHELPKRLGVCGHHSTCSTNPWADRGEVIMGATIALRPCLVRSGRNDATNHFASVHFCSASALPGTIHDMICIRRCSYERASHLPPCLDVFSLWELSRDHAGTALFPVKFLCFVCRLWTLRYLDRLSQCLDFFIWLYSKSVVQIYYISTALFMSCHSTFYNSILLQST
jgi:hypothetical protein